MPDQAPFSDGRVAQAGKGNSTTSQTGISGWETNIVPGLAEPGPVRRQEPVLGAVGLGSVEASGDPQRQLAMTRRSTSLAICRAPIRITPRERPRSATSRRICFDGRGLLEARTCSARRELGTARGVQDLTLPCRRSRLAVTPTTNLFALSGRLCRSTTVTWARRCVSCTYAERDVGADEVADRRLRRQEPPYERIDAPSHRRRWVPSGGRLGAQPPSGRPVRGTCAGLVPRAPRPVIERRAAGRTVEHLAGPPPNG